MVRREEDHPPRTRVRFRGGQIHERSAKLSLSRRNIEGIAPLFERSNPIALRCGEDFVYACSSLEHATGEKEETASPSTPSTTCFAAAIDIGAGKTMLWTRVYDMGKFKFAHFAELAAAI